jgi:uncharacterized protein YcgL (UPF0745 family)
MDPTMIMGGIGAVGGLLGGLFGKEDPAKKQMEQMMKLYGQAKKDQDWLYGAARQQQAMVLPTLQKGFEKANKFADMYGKTAKQGAYDQSKQMGSAMQQSMTQRGLYNTTAFDNAQRGISSDLSRTLMGIDESVAGMKGQLASQQAAAEAGAYGAMSGFYQNYAGANTQLLGAQAGAMGNVQFQDPNAWAGSLTQLGGTLLGYGMTYGANKPVPTSNGLSPFGFPTPN